MLRFDLCSICGNNHSGACSSEPIYFYWHPTNVSRPPNYVQIVGEWHKWQKHQEMQRQVDEKGQIYFQIQISIPVGIYQYKYVVDGKWLHDQDSPKTQDSYGSYNNIVEIFPKKAYLQYIPQQDTKITSSMTVEGLKIKGSWDNWKAQIPMNKTYNSLKGCYENVIYLKLKSNKSYEFKFKLGKQYIIDEKYPTVENQFGTLNNHIIIYSQRISTPTGWRNTKNIQSNVVMNCKCFQWEKIAVENDLPYQRVEGHSMCHIGEHIYIFGGKMRQQFIHTLAKININKFNNTEIEQVLPNGRAFHNMVTYGNKIIIYGGHNNIILQDYYSFNTNEGIWQVSPQIQGISPKKKQKQSCVLYQMLLVIFGGYFCSADFQYQQFFNSINVLDIQKMKWIPEEAIHVTGELPKGRFSHSASLVYSDMYVFGGVYNSVDNLNLNDIWKLNLQTVNKLTWQKLDTKGKKPIPRHGHTMNTVNNFLIIFGGRGDNNIYLNDVVVFDTIKSEWIYPIISGQLPQPRYNHASTVVGNQYLAIFGGRLKEKRRNKHLHLLKPKEYKPTLDIEEQQDEQK